MTIIDPARAAAQTIDTTGCPAWCSEHMPPDPLDLEICGASPIVHQHPVGELGVSVEWCPRDPEVSAPVVYVPELDVDSLSASPAFARQLGADLLAAADLIDGVTA